MNTKNKMTERTLKKIEKISGTKLTIGKLLWAIRQSEGKLQIDFADQLKITKQHLCDIEHERKSISPKLAAKYADILGYSREQFIRLALQDLVDKDKLNVRVEVLSLKNKHSSHHGISV